MTDTLKMDEIVCPNCGSNDFTHEGGMYRCSFCQTLFLEDDSELHELGESDKQRQFLKEAKEAADESEREKKKQGKSKRRLIALVGLVLVVVLLILIVKSPHQSQLKQEVANSQSYALAHLGEVPGWSKDYYDSIVIATANYKNESYYATYTGGTSYAEVVAKVGKPVSVDKSLDKKLTWKYATFQTDKPDKNGRTIYIMIDYDTKTGKVVNKEVGSY